MVKICLVKDCERKHYAKGYCSKHYWHIWYFGYIKERTILHSNEFVVDGDICFISLYNGKSEKIAEAVIDAEDYEKCKPYKWCGDKNKNGNIYVVNKVVGTLAPFIINFKSTTKMVVDHKDGNTLDNRKQNLQIITNQQNIWKQKKQKCNTSGYRGVFWNSWHHKWMTSIRYNGKSQHLGYFFNKGEAAYAYNEKAMELFGEFAVLNKVFQSEYKMPNRLFKTRKFNITK